MKRMTQKQYDALSAKYRDIVDGVPYALHQDAFGRTVYGPVEITAERQSEADPIFSPQAREWLRMTIRLYDARQNGFGVSPEIWQEVRGRGWYKTVRGWLSLTEKGRREIPQYIEGQD